MTRAPEAVWIASQNQKKARELERLLAGIAVVRTLAQAPGSETFDVVEDAPDFCGNAAKKAVAAAAFLGERGLADQAIVVADDSGLCVDSLDGRPGVLSARWAGPEATDADRTLKLLDELAGVPDERRTARFVCALVAVHGDGLPFFSTEAVCEGKILRAPSGDSGFGYDPVFVPREAPAGRECLSFAALTAAEKDTVSHRGKALRQLARALQDASSPQ